MRYRLSPTHPWTRYDGDDASDGDGNPCRESEPTMRSPLVQIDLTDPATVGCLAAWCREVYGDPFLHAVPTGARWQIRTGGWRHRPAVAEGITECDAWAAAILAKLEPK
jgi:hypothetical protein